MLVLRLAFGSFLRHPRQSALAVLAVATVGAVALDEYRSRKKQP
jgi:hypothetical protein